MTTVPANPLLRCLRRVASDPDPDGKLLDRFRNGRDETAFAELVRRHAGMVYGVCLRVLRNPHDAEDAFQAVFVVLVRRAGELTGRATVGGWLYAVAHRTALKARATAMRRRVKDVTAARPIVVEAVGQDAVEMLDAELASLPEKYREPLVLCELEGKSRKEVAVALRVPVGTLSSRLATGKRLLADRLRRHGFALAPGFFAAGPSTLPAGLIGAALRAAAGNASSEVMKLAMGVTKTMFLMKLRAGAAAAAVVFLLGVVAAVFPRAAAEPPGLPKAIGPARLTALQLQQKEKAAMEAMRGTWLLRRTLLNGEEQENQFEYYRWDFDGRSVKIAYKMMNENTFSAEHTAVVNPTTEPAQMNVHSKGTLLLAIYQQDGDRLKIAIHGRSEVERPRGFDPKATRVAGMPLIVWELKRKK